MLESLGHHRVGEHRKDGAAGEGEHERDHGRARVVEQGVARERRDAADDRHEHPEPQDLALLPASLREAGRGRDRLGQVGEEDGDEECDAHRAFLEHGQAEHQRLGDAVEHDAEHDRHRRAGRLASAECLRSSPPMRSIRLSAK